MAKINPKNGRGRPKRVFPINSGPPIRRRGRPSNHEPKFTVINSDSKWRGINPEKHKASQELRKAIWRGEIEKPKECSKCKKRKRIIHGHHEDYSKPLEVRWLCVSCHGKERKAEKPKKPVKAKMSTLEAIAAVMGWI